MGRHFPAKRLCLFKLCVVFWNWHGLSPLLRCQTCGSPLASPCGRGAPDGAERAFLPSQSLRDSSPRVGAKGRPELGQAFGHHGRPPSCGSPLASPFGRGAQCAHWAERAICKIRSAETATEAKDSNCRVEVKISKLVIHSSPIDIMF